MLSHLLTEQTMAISPQRKNHLEELEARWLSAPQGPLPWQHEAHLDFLHINQMTAWVRILNGRGTNLTCSQRIHQGMQIKEAMNGNIWGCSYFWSMMLNFMVQKFNDDIKRKLTISSPFTNYLYWNFFKYDLEQEVQPPLHRRYSEWFSDMSSHCHLQAWWNYTFQVTSQTCWIRSCVFRQSLGDQYAL